MKISELGLRIILTFVIVAGGMAYIALTTSTATKGLEVKDFGDRLEALNAKSEVLQAEVDRLQSMEYLERVTKGLDLVRISKMDFITGAGGAVASR